MFDLSSQFDRFYRECVVLPQSEQTSLRAKADTNIARLKSGLSEYNAEHNTSYKVSETCVQGSVAMHTVVQNEDNDYDIDVAIVFDKQNVGDLGTRAIKNMVADALKRKTSQFNAEPEVKTSCVRVKYADGYHVDFAVYRREFKNNQFVYEHAGSDWQKRELTGITDWFEEQNDATEKNLRKVIRLSKMFCKSRSSWRMPSGLVQTVVISEKLANSDLRIDEMFYYTMKSVVERIAESTAVSAPVDNGRPLVTREKDVKRMNNWKTRLASKLDDLDVLFKDTCTEKDAVAAWAGFFNHSYWSEQTEERKSAKFSAAMSRAAYDDTEQFIEDLYPVNLTETVSINCNVSGDGFRTKPLNAFLSVLARVLPHNLKLECSIARSSVAKPDKVLWKVRNVGPEAERRNDIRGQIIERGPVFTENTRFFGDHYIECFVIKDGVCVARKRISVPIGR